MCQPISRGWWRERPTRSAARPLGRRDRDRRSWRCGPEWIARRASALTLLRRPIFLVPLVVLLVLSAAAGWSVWRSGRAGARLGLATLRCRKSSGSSDREEYDAAYRLAQQALTVVPDDPHLRQMYLNSTVLATITSDPPDSSVEMKGYLTFRTRRGYSLGQHAAHGCSHSISGCCGYASSKDGYQSVEASLSGRRIAV